MGFLEKLPVDYGPNTGAGGGGNPEKRSYNPVQSFVDPLRRELISGGLFGERPVEWSAGTKPVVVDFIYHQLWRLHLLELAPAVNAAHEAFAPPMTTRMAPFPKDNRTTPEQDVYTFLDSLTDRSRRSSRSQAEENLRERYDNSEQIRRLAIQIGRAHV